MSLGGYEKSILHFLLIQPSNKNTYKIIMILLLLLEDNDYLYRRAIYLGYKVKIAYTINYLKLYLNFYS
jgi:hypothetical protein